MLKYPLNLKYSTDTVAERTGGSDIDDVVRELRSTGKLLRERDGAVEGADAGDDQVSAGGQVGGFFMGCGDKKCCGHAFRLMDPDPIPARTTQHSPAHTYREIYMTRQHLIR